METSQVGIDAIKLFEGFRDTAYLDIGGKGTIGFGHLIKPGEDFPDIISSDAAESLLKADLSVSEAAINSNVIISLAQFQFDALSSFVFNVGGGNFKSSTLLHRLNNNQVAGAAAEFLRWNRVGGKFSQGLAKRRNAEMALFLGGNFNAVKFAFEG